MRTGFILPSCNYNIHISKVELEQLLETGHLSAVISHTPCRTGRYVYENDRFKNLGSRECCNNLRFLLDDSVADIDDRDWHVQFLTINVDKEVGTV